MQHYYRVKCASGHVATLHTYSGWDEVVAEYGDELIGEVNGRGVLQRLHIPSDVKATIDWLLLSMNADNVEEITLAVNKLYQTALPDYRERKCSPTQLHQDYYNNVIIPSLFPKDKCKVSESPMMHRVFADLFSPLHGTDQAPIGYHPKDADPQAVADIVKIVNGKQVVDTDALDERSRRMQLARSADPVIAKRVDAFSEALEPQTVKTPEEVGITVPLPNSGLSMKLRMPKYEDYFLAKSKSLEIINQICTNMFGKDWQMLRTNVNPPVEEKTAYELWLEDGNMGKVEDFLYEASRTANISRGPDFKETVKYFYNEDGKTKTVIRNSNEGDYSIATYPVAEPAIGVPTIKGVILKGSNTGKSDEEITQRLIQFVKKNFPLDQYDEIIATLIPNYVKSAKDIVPPELQRIVDSLKFSKGHLEAALIGLEELATGDKPEATEVEEATESEPVLVNGEIWPTFSKIFAEARRAKESRLVIDCDVYGIHDKFLQFLTRCDEEQLNTVTPSAYDRDHFDKIYAANRCAIGSQIGAVLTPHLKYQGVHRSFMVDAAENNVFRVLRQSRDSYRPLATVRFNKGFFNIEMH